MDCKIILLSCTSFACAGVRGSDQLTPTMSSIKDNEKYLIKYLEEFRLRPSKVSAELFYFTLTTPVWANIQKVLFEWFDIYSELGSSELTTYDELRHLGQTSLPVHIGNVFFLFHSFMITVSFGKNQFIQVLKFKFIVGSVSSTGFPDRFCLYIFYRQFPILKFFNLYLYLIMTFNFSHRIFVASVVSFIMGLCGKE